MAGRKAPEPPAKRPTGRRDREKVKGEEVTIPIDPVSEIVMFAAVVHDSEARKKYLHLPTDYFHAAGHPEMWAGLQELFRRGLSYSPEALRSIVGDRVDTARLDDYVEARPGRGLDLDHYVNRLKWDKARHDSVPVLEMFVEALRDPTASPTKVQSLLKRVSGVFDGHGDRRYLRDSQAVVASHAVQMTARREGHAVFPYGIEGLDRYGAEDFRIAGNERFELAGKYRMIPGCAPGYMTVVSGESSSGKSTLMANIVLALASRGEKTLWGSWEQGDENSLEMLAAIKLRLNLADLRTGFYDKEEQEEVLDTMSDIGRNVTFFTLPFGRASSDGKRKYNDENMDLIFQHVSESGCQHFVADLFHMALEQTKPDDEKQALYRMQSMSKELHVHSFLVHQLLLKGENVREDHVPTKSVVAGSGAWVGAADTLLATYRPGLFIPGIDDDKLQIYILKQRFGYTGAVEFDWTAEHGNISNGRTIIETKPNEQSAIDGFLGENVTVKKGKPRKRW